MDVDEGVSGFEVRGSWGDVVEHGERLTRALKDLLEEDQPVDEAALEQWDEWRPKADERLGEDVSQKTAEQASVAEGEGEKAGKDPDEDLKTAGEKLADSYDNLEDPEEAVDEWRESINYVARAADSATRKALRKVEGSVYKNVMTQVSPYYFDNELVSANLRRADTDDYVFEVNINDDDLKIRVSNKLADYEMSVDRWHVDTPKATDVAEAVEGHAPPEDEETAGESDPKKN
jgi:chemotaxis regulatin CheY-phosphate phosphatase CheZ